MALAVILGGRFTGVFPTAASRAIAKQLWEKALIGFTDVQLHQAALDCKNFPNNRIFNLEGFNEICEGIRRRESDKPVIALQRPPRTAKEITQAKEYIAKMRETLRMAGAKGVSNTKVAA